MTTTTEPREGYARALIELGHQHDDVFVLDADCAKSNYTNRFRDEFPDRFFNMGIAECDIVGTAAGMAALGKVHLPMHMPTSSLDADMTKFVFRSHTPVGM